MKKRLAIAIMCTALAVSMSGCGTDDTTASAAGQLATEWVALPAEPEAEIEGSLIAGNDESTSTGNADQKPASSQSPEAGDNAAEESKYSNLNITEKTLILPGITGDYSFLFLSDTHIITLDGTEDGQVTENALPRTELVKDAQGTESYKNFPVWIEYANETDADMVLLGGDIIDFPSEANLRLLTENLESLQMPYAYTLGNHDWTYPWEYMTAAGRQQYRPLFAPFTENNPSAHIIEYEELVILCVDNSSNKVEAEALSVTDEALSIGKPVIVMLHVPFSTKTLLEKAAAVWSSPVSIGMADKGGISPDANTLDFQEKILAADSPVVCVLAGHVHFSDDAMLTDSIVQLVAGAGYLNEGIILKIHGE